MQPSTTYYVRAYATNSGGTTYGGVVSFTTGTPANNPASVTTGNISSITINSANAAGNITDIGSSTVTQYGHVWSSTNTNPTTADSKTDLGTTTIATGFNSSLTGLQPSTTYYVRAYATNSGGTTYGGVVSFTTGAPANNPASVTTGSISNITLNTASAAGNITDIGSSTVTQYGHVWSSTNNLPTVNDSKTQLGSANAPLNFSSSLAGLSPSTTYFVRAYAINSGGTTYGAVVSFTTATPANNPAAVTTGSISSITVNSANAAGNISDIGSSPVTQYGHVFSTTNTTPTTADSKTDLGATGAPTSFNSSLTGLSANTTYYVRAYAVNSAGTTYGGVVSFTTGAPANNPASVTTDSVRQITLNSATAYGNITSIGNSTVTQYGHVWSSTNMVPTINDSKTQLGSANAPTIFNSSLTGLSVNTSYYVRAYAVNNGGTTYGAVISFTTQDYTLAYVENIGVYNITQTTASSNANLYSTGNSPVTQHGHVWSSTNPTPGLLDSKTQLGAGSVGIFNSNLTGLQPNTLYYIRPYATNSAGTAFGSTVQTFTTAANNPPTVTTNTISNITASSANADGSITSIGSTTVTQYGHVYSSTNTVPTINDSKTQLGTASGPLNYSSSLSGLTAGTLYYVRAYAINSGGTSYGAVVRFTTTSDAASVTTDDPYYNAANFTIYFPGTITSIGSSPVTEHGHVYSSTNTVPSLDNRGDSFTQLGPAGTGPYNSTFRNTSFIPYTIYYVRAYVTNASGTAYGVVKTFTFTP